MSKSLGQGKSLKFKLLSLSLGITLVLGAASWGVLKYILTTQEKAQLSSFEAYSRNLGDAISAQLFERYGDVQAFALNPDVRASNKDTIITALNAYSAMYGIYDLIMVVDAKGRLVAVTNKSPTGAELKVDDLYKQNYSEAPWFKAVITGQTTDDKEKNYAGTFIEDIHIDPYVSPVYGGNRLGNSFSAAVKNSRGDVIGVITNRAGSRWFEVAFKETWTSLARSGFRRSDLAMLDKDGVLLFEYESDPASTVAGDSKYDWGTLLKYNVAKANSAAALSLVSRQAGSGVEKHPRTGEVQILGYSPITSPKFIEKIGWSVIVRDDQAEAMADLNRAQKIFYSIFAIVVGFAAAVGLIFSTALSKALTNLASKLSEGSTEVFSAAASISQSSTSLSEAATEQASAIQETAASIDEVSSMIKKSAENASQSQKVSQTSRSAAEQGQRSVQEMIQSINDISQSNASIMSQVEQGNRQISEIVRVIAEIGNKTKVINDIVFQTKLLSFNASVEAARAGEHGKGFAVVAEEVGNLAQMSGNAAKEISSMLESSIQKVERIVNDTKVAVERLVVESRAKVEAGTEVAGRCGDALNNILSTVQEVDGMVGEIASASHEQAQGVAEINKAVNQLDQVTQQNTAIAQSAATSAEQLSNQASQLRQMVSDLFLVINGTAVDGAPATAAKPKDDQKGKGDHGKSSKVVSIASSKKPASHGVSNGHAAASPMKMAAGAEAMSSGAPVPSRHDPRFEDV
ncbi:MAG: hypothetical protein RJB38_1941 [Pseudomonadota bacterium]|jgi:methyl-accepting chemotaxis protein